MSSTQVGEFLSALRRAAALSRLYGPDHPLTDSAIADAAAAADRLPETDGATVITVLEEGLYLGRFLLPGISLAYDEILQALGLSGIESITFRHPVEADDMRDLAALLGAKPGQQPTGRTVLLNQAPWSRAQLVRGPASPLRGAYASSLDALRAIGREMTGDGQFPLSTLAAEVRSLLDLSLRQPAAALLLSTMKSHHEYTLYHSVNVCLLALALGRTAGMGDGDLVLLGMGGLLHDMGKLALPTSLLDAPGQLSREQWEDMRRHPQLGAQVILTAAEPGQEAIAAVALEHHVGYDGQGYPHLQGRSPAGGDLLHPFTHLVAVADAYDAITTHRTYRRAEVPARAVQALIDGAGTSFHPDVVAAFVDVMGLYPPGSLLRLSGGEIVMVMEAAEGEPPTAALVMDSFGERLAHPDVRSLDPREVVDLLTPEAAGVFPAEVLEALDLDSAAGVAVPVA